MLSIEVQKCYSVEMSTSGHLLREARRRAGLTQAQLGSLVGRPQSAIARWENGRVEPSLETLRELIRACGLELSVALYNYDDSYVPFIERNLALTPADRIRHMADVARAMQPLKGAVVRARDA
jgi:transcriptional regulator with XRE-family HTH domain